ncbi:nitrate- and nitrite sensing domain-containing protein [Streptomyces sp. NPDC004327]|uniref:nitrate- and nitrite sensing domain-containing protein n=1 Tax=Streptomyces sp. NPDC004327 TaxID=3364699 RepID=UPI0036B1AE2E
MRTPRRTPDDGAPAQPPTAARGRRAHAGPPADEPAAPRAWTAEPTAEHPAARTSEPYSTRTQEPPTRAGSGPAATTPATAPVTDAPPEPAPAGPPARGPHGLRPRTVRAKIVSLLMVPVVSLLALWGFATVTTAQDIARLRLLQSVDIDVRQPVVHALAALQDERRAAVRQAAAPGAGRAAELKDRARATDAAVARLRLDDRHTVADSGGLPADVSTRLAAFVTRAASLDRLRGAAVAGSADADRLYTTYTETIAAGFAVGGALASIEDPRSGPEARVLLELARSGEMLAREDTLLGAAQLTGHFEARPLREFGGAVAARRTLTDSATADLPTAQRTAWRELAATPGYRGLTAAEDRLLAATPGRHAAQAVTPGDWDTAHAFVRDGTTTVEQAARAAAADRHDPFGGGVPLAGAAAVLLGLAAVAASLAISVRIGRGLVVELVSLRNTALEIARRKLPAAMRRLRAGEELDVHAEAPPGPAPLDEIGQVGEALTTVHRAALSAAVERAELASGISGVFVNLARRSQVLVHRQLNLLDSMERRVDDPNELGDLFRLDHLTTRMRRHAESLIILSGAAPGRAWRVPVPLTNVVRAAVSEIEDYARVELRQLPETSVTGGAVADLTHLLAELIENAAQFSPPHTKVRISGEPVGNGYALEIEDRGLGMGRETLAEANARIDRSEALDLFDSDRLGLFVVSRLSARHDIKVHLRTSPYGGTTAVVLLPTDVLQGALPPGRTLAPETVSHAAGPGAAGEWAAAAQPAVPRPRTAAGPPRTSAPAAPESPSPRALAEPGPPPAGVTSLRTRNSAPDDGRGEGQAQEPGQEHGQEDAREDGSQQGRRQEQGERENGDGGDIGDLPRRVRQASLVPQLRQAPPAPDPASLFGDVDAPETRTPEQVRDRMSAYRDGWRRGGGAAPGTSSTSSTSSFSGTPDVPAAPRRTLGNGHAPDSGRGPVPSDPAREGDDE